MKKIFAIIAFVMVAVCCYADDNYIYAEDTNIGTDGTVVLSVKMKNSVTMTGFQFDLVLPEGVSVEMDDEFYVIDLSTVRTTARKTDYFNSAKQADGSIRVMCSSTKSYTFSGTDGEVATVSLKGSASSSGVIRFKNIVLSDANGKTYKTAETTCNLYSAAPTQKCGAPTVTFANGKLSFTSETAGAVFHYVVTPRQGSIEGTTDGTVDMTDNMIFDVSVYATATDYTSSDVVNITISQKVGDVNGDGVVNIADVNAVISIMCGQ